MPPFGANPFFAYKVNHLVLMFIVTTGAFA